MSPGATRASPIFTATSRGVELHAIFPRAHGIALAEDRIAELQAERRVAARAVDHRAGDSTAVRDLRQNIAPDRGVFPAAVVDGNDRAGRDVINEFTDRPGGFAHRAIEHGERPARRAKTWIAWLDIQALARNAQAVERVADRRCVEFACAF